MSVVERVCKRSEETVEIAGFICISLIFILAEVRKFPPPCFLLKENSSLKKSYSSAVLG